MSVLGLNHIYTRNFYGNLKICHYVIDEFIREFHLVENYEKEIYMIFYLMQKKTLLLKRNDVFFSITL